MSLLLKSKVGMPRIQFHGERIDLAGEARKSPPPPRAGDGRLFGLRPDRIRPGSALAPQARGCRWRSSSGAALWTLVEYFAHRKVLHQRFPDGPGLFQRWLHRTFDNLHTEHHARPWDGNHINGTIKDTWL